MTSNYKFSPYSYSKQESWHSCPQKFKLNYIDKIKVQTEHSAFEKGSFFHKVIEDDLLSDVPWHEETEFNFKLLNKTEQDILKAETKIFLNSEYYKKIKEAFNKSETGVELGFAFDEEWNAIEYTKESLLLGYIDCVMIHKNTAVVIDWKTGKYKEPKWQTYDQVMLYALWIFKMYPEVESVKGIYCYVEHDKQNSKVYTRQEMKIIETTFKNKLSKIENDDKFNKNVSKLCAWCDYFKQGYCELSESEILKYI